MQLNEIKYLVYFEYIKNIRQYLYDFEVYLKNKDLFSIQGLVVPISDEIEPNNPRLHIIKEFENKTINILISQVSITVSIQYKVNINLIQVDSELDFLNEVSKSIKTFFISNIDKFNINFESLSVVANKLYKNNDDITKVNVSQEQDEIRERKSIEINDELFFVDELNIFKTYELKTLQNNIIDLVRNKKENFVGWNMVIVKEVNNRLSYNNDNDELFDFKKAKNLILKSYNEEQ